jgi:NADH:ubiquinone oxidoreductase subunit 3 (subunit A)
MIFIPFDIEAVFLILPSSTATKMFAFGEMFVFVALVMVGFFTSGKRCADWATEKVSRGRALAERARIAPPTTP